VLMLAGPWSYSSHFQQSWDDRHVQAFSALLVERCVTNFFPRWALNCSLSYLSLSSLARISDVSHHAQLTFVLKNIFCYVLNSMLIFFYHYIKDIATLSFTDLTSNEKYSIILTTFTLYCNFSY
jgi:hypothetical protein